MSEMVKAMVRVGASQMEMREYPMPDVPEDAALMKVVLAGICGTDVKMYKKPQKNEHVIMGHENIGYIAKAGKLFTERGEFLIAQGWLGIRISGPCASQEFVQIGDAILVGVIFAE